MSQTQEPCPKENLQASWDRRLYVLDFIRQKADVK